MIHAELEVDSGAGSTSDCAWITDREAPVSGRTAGLDEVILGHVLPALVLEHHLGQFLALPELVEGYRAPARRPLARDHRRT